MNENMLLVLADADGRLLAAYVPRIQDLGAPAVTLRPGEGQVVRQVEAPQALREAGLSAEVLRKFRLEVRGESSRLVPAGQPDRD